MQKLSGGAGKSLSEALIFPSPNPIWQKIVHWISSSVHENYKLRIWVEHGLVDAKMRASDKDLPVKVTKHLRSNERLKGRQQNINFWNFLLKRDGDNWLCLKTFKGPWGVTYGRCGGSWSRCSKLVEAFKIPRLGCFVRFSAIL